MIEKRLNDIIERWGLFEPVLFRVICTHELVKNEEIKCPMRCGKRVIEYNPNHIDCLKTPQIEVLLKVEAIRILLKHPYERKPESCSQKTVSLSSNLVISDNYRALHMVTPENYGLKKGLSYEEYCWCLRDMDKIPQSYADLSELWEEDECVSGIINDIIKSAKNWGSIPGQITEQLELPIKSTYDWQKVLYCFKASILSTQTRLTRMRPNRRTGFDNMGSTRKYITSLLIAVDISGSISNEVIMRFYSAISSVFKYGFTSVDVIHFDCGIRSVQSLKSAPKKVIVVGRGGTSFDEPIQYAQDHHYDALVIMTDGCAKEPRIPQKIKCKILWVCEDKKAYDSSHSWMRKSGRVCYMNEIS